MVEGATQDFRFLDAGGGDGVVRDHGRFGSRAAQRATPRNRLTMGSIGWGEGLFTWHFRKSIEICWRVACRKPRAWEDFVDRYMGLVLHVVDHSAQSRSIRLGADDREDLGGRSFSRRRKGRLGGAAALPGLRQPGDISDCHYPSCRCCAHAGRTRRRWRKPIGWNTPRRMHQRFRPGGATERS